MTVQDQPTMPEMFIASETRGNIIVVKNKKAYYFYYPVGDTIEQLDEIVTYLDSKIKEAVKNVKEKAEKDAQEKKVEPIIESI